jgi:hypothetical protein
MPLDHDETSLAAYSMTGFFKEADIESKLHHVSEGEKPT